MSVFAVSYELSVWGWVLVAFAAMSIGMAKVGLSGFGTLPIPIFALLFGGMPSTGLLVPILCIADIFAVFYFNRHAQWSYIVKLLPWALLGIFIALLVGQGISDVWFRKIIGVVVLVSVGLMLWRDLRKKPFEVPRHWGVAASLGLLGGFATMIGNAAGAIMAIYLLSMNLPKNHYIGTVAWFFFIVNLIKIPLHVFFWETITWESFQFNLLLLPAIVLGVWVGIKTIHLFSDKAYRYFIIFMTALSSLLLIVR